MAYLCASSCSGMCFLFQREDATSQSSFSGQGQKRNSINNKMDGSSSSVTPQSTLIHPQNGCFEGREHLIQESLKQKIP
jgi:hypothetical protein